MSQFENWAFLLKTGRNTKRFGERTPANVDRLSSQPMQSGPLYAQGNTSVIIRDASNQPVGPLGAPIPYEPELTVHPPTPTKK